MRIDRDKAWDVLARAYNEPKRKVTDDIRGLLEGNHKTYKYMLLTGLLARATEPRANPLALQAGADVDGAYDARGLCHKVLVPFERDLLHGVLGRSNEPFLNKPARFQTISMDNAVRAGRDKDSLAKLIRVLEGVNTQDDAYSCLCEAMTVIKGMMEAQDNYTAKAAPNATIIEIYGTVQRLVERSCGGETSVIAVAALEKIYCRAMQDGYEVRVHKVNQSGASSNEVADIDVYRDDKLHAGIEVKDKKFEPGDLSHAFEKMKSNGASRLAFVYGPHASYDQKAVEAELARWVAGGFVVVFHEVMAHTASILFRVRENAMGDFRRVLLETADEINCSQDTKSWVRQVISEE